MEGEIDEKALYADFENLHDLPEIGFREFQTSSYIEHELQDLGIPVQHMGETGLLARLEGKAPGVSLALRADMDALSFCRENGEKLMMHACGHDAHCAMVLAAGRHFAAHRLEKGRLYLLFQPAEETLLGAKKILACGLPRLEGMIGIHLRPKSEIPLGTATPSLIHCASFPITANFHGRASHAARPQLGINALSSGAMAIIAVDGLSFDTKETWSAKATIADSHGNLHNVIPEYCSVTFDIRSESNKLGDTISEAVKRISAEAAKKVGCTVTFNENPAYAPRYDPSLVDTCKQAIEKVLGRAEPPTHTPGSEDFHAYSVQGGIPTAYIGLGADLTPGLHSTEMHFNHACMPEGVKILVEAASLFFKQA